MPRAKVSDTIELEYEMFGDAGAPPLVLVMGFSMQMIAWDERFCAQLAARGFRVVRFDNRDVGLSTKLSHHGLPDVMRMMMGDATVAPYAIGDMADDLAGLITTLGIAPAHIVGASMGGFIVQETAIRHPDAVKSVCSIMSSTGDRSVGQPRTDVLPIFLTPVPTEKAAAMDHSVKLWKAIGSPVFPFDEARIRSRSEAQWARCHDADGIMRQVAAIFTQRDRTADLGRVRAPTVVVHGAEDPLVMLSGGQATAKAIPGARLVVVPDMGHDMPPVVWPALIDAIVDNAHRADA
jgi:pimeloyl-ACP methyl ester carboxylesterase